jgi:hypothetical protein
MYFFTSGTERILPWCFLGNNKLPMNQYTLAGAGAVVTDERDKVTCKSCQKKIDAWLQKEQSAGAPPPMEFCRPVDRTERRLEFA